ncbi:hypothetical protein AWM68_01395 [Fictibacillus phosphorivorans]|uniref:Family 2 glycosyl transferase n=1 Tax=Fictibacillus phosphorivorans TaxID=1221500 RepID=A0A163SFI3_9BACL|nr:hypothetical protein [Fictibacillus phosphorivorans]KZE68952.1 hypothetical protein AWM68_01395 [Fictibacillus phosphorivorans]
MNTLQKSRKRFFLLFIFLVIALLTSPFWVWWLKQEKELNVAIVDKTVKEETYREHSGLVWALNHMKIQNKNGEAYEERKHFSRSVPQFHKDKMPKVLYLADSYGVERINHENKPSVEGGLTNEEVENIRHAVMSGKTNLIAEFNTFASPTGKEAREGISELLNVEWSGWIGRYFSDLNGKEVPPWVKKNYVERYGEWTFKDGGMLFVHEKGKMVVLEDRDMKKKGATFSFTDEGEKTYGLEASVPYHYWFDIVKPFSEKEVMAQYELKLTDSGKQKVQKHQIPTVFPAIIHHQNAAYQATYFAGDYADQAELPELYQSWGISWIKQKFALDDGQGSTFYWKVYLPLMKSILQNDRPASGPKQSGVEVEEKNDIKINARAEGNYLQVLQNGKWEDMLIKGVNMGIAKPGSFPGETAISKSEYFRWFKRIGEMNANAIRVYTIHPPGFYEAFYEYNKIAKKPLFLFHGVWVNEDQLIAKQDVYAPEVSEAFQNEIKNVVDIVNGNATIPKVPGHAGGEYRNNISQYVLGYILGVEWDPEVVVSTNKKHQGKNNYSGDYFSSVDASPFESWLASMLDYTTKYETDTYNWQHAVSHVNWVTTDTLKHPAEPFGKEDRVSVDPNAIKPQGSFKSGYFASYHVYPYYPDFLNYEKKYLDYVDQRGKKNNYAGYLNDLRNVHEMPVVVAEFGVPSSRGITHENAFGWDQGHHSEKEQGTMDAMLFEDIVEEKMAGGMVFTWQDEWFKRTWNTMDFDNPDRRPFWSNAQTNEQQFGLLSFDPESPIKADGEVGDWVSIAPYQSSSKNKDLKSLYVTSDNRYVYMRIDYNKKIDLENLNTTILVDTISEQGQLSSPDRLVKMDAGAEFAINLVNTKKSRILVDSYYDANYYLYGHELQMIEQKDYASKKNNGIYHPITMVLNKELTIPSTKQVIPFQSFETGKLHFGNGNPASENYDSLTDVSVNEKEGIVELRIPWLLLNVKDPSLHEVMGDMWSGKLKGSKKTDGFAIATFTYNEDGKKVVDSLPIAKEGVIPLSDTKKYRWDEWNEPLYQERLKQSYYEMQKTYEKVKRSEE